MGLSLTVLGCSGTWAAPGNPCSGYLVQSGATAVWLDAGPGTLGEVQRHVALTDLDAVVVSHSHPDHWLELPVLRNALRYGLGASGLAVFGTAETLALCRAVVGSDLEPTLRWTVIADGSTFTVGALTLTCSRTDHPVETLAVRVDGGGRSLAYSADTGPAWSLDALTDGGDRPVELAVLEATLTPDEVGSVQHLSAAQAGAIARAGRAERLLLTHLPPGADAGARLGDAAKAFGAPVDLATPGVRYDV